ncbi:SDR family NAD(P)-dependent oxidoreductase, partial [Klebsiella pneumoniae]|uniref:SDR family NAD(P)-dependent oxidoreductase n=1 Tax=Klebsiella pneumoniae TaxID=573 RepID=UPI0013D3E626
TDLSLETAERTAGEIREAGGRAEAHVLDVADAAAGRTLAVAIGKSLGPVSIVVNNAGICPRHGLDSPELERLWD